MEVSGAFRRSLNTACSLCRKRKIRCDAVSGRSCTPCTKAGVECTTHPTRPSSTRSRAAKANQRRSYADQTSPSQSDTGSNKSTGVPSLPLPSPFKDSETTANNLADFFDCGVMSSKWEWLGQNGMRVLYIGTGTANINHLVKNHEIAHNNFTHYQCLPHQDPLPWKPQTQHGIQSYLTAEAVSDLSTFPTHAVRDALVDTYFKDIHPGFPIVDEASFRTKYRNREDPPPLLVFHAVLLAAARVSGHPMVVPHRRMVTATLFRRAKTLFDMRYENDRLELVQAACLMAWHTANSDTISSNAYYWIGTAVRISFGMGIHRSGAVVYTPVGERRALNQYRKVWWSLLHMEAFLSLEYGRPCQIRAEDYDTLHLSDEDFFNLDESEDGFVNARYCSLSAEMSVVALNIHRLQAPGSRKSNFALEFGQVSDRLAMLALRIPSTHDFWAYQLRVIYNLLVLILGRTNRERDDSGVLCSEAASNILTSFEAMAVQNTIRQCYPTCLQALMAAAIQFFEDVKQATAKGSKMQAISKYSQLERLCSPVQTLAGYWPNMEALDGLCASLSTRARMLIENDQAQDMLQVQTEVSEPPIGTHLNWQDILAGLQFPSLEMDLHHDINNWMNSSSY